MAAMDGVLAAGQPAWRLIMVVLFALPTLLFVVVSFFDYDRVGMYPAFHVG